MKVALWCIYFALVIFSCNNKSKTTAFAAAPIDTTETNKPEMKPLQEENSIRYVNDCENEIYKAVLYESVNADTNVYELKIKFNDGRPDLIQRLDFRPRASRINYCTDKYINMGFSCGGPCWVRFFFYIDKKTSMKTFGYCERVVNDDDIVIYRRDEVFDEVIIHNLENGKEKVVRIIDCELVTSPCLMDTLYVAGDHLIMEYDRDGERSKRKVINIARMR
jgi:hypothetical protein